MLGHDRASGPSLHSGRVNVATLRFCDQETVRDLADLDFWRICSRLEHHLLRSLQDDLIKTCQEPPSLVRYFELTTATAVLLSFHSLVKITFPQKVRTKIPYKSTLGGIWT
jgi:hypothetical protein